MLAGIIVALVMWNQPGTAEEPRKPVCNADTAGDFWPAEANRDSNALAKFARSGELEVCSHGYWRYRWIHLTVRVNNPKKPPVQEIPEKDQTVPLRH